MAELSEMVELRDAMDPFHGKTKEIGIPLQFNFTNREITITSGLTCLTGRSTIRDVSTVSHVHAVATNGGLHVLKSLA